MGSGNHAVGSRPGVLKSILSFVAMVIVVLVVVYGMRTYVMEPFEVPSGSMEDTIMTGDRIFAEKVSYLVGSPRQGDIVVFSDPQIPSRVLVKRVIAAGGQTVNLVGGTVYVDGVPLSESYTEGKQSLPLATASNVDISYPYTVPAGKVWVMGDNRTNSADSRYFGPVDESAVFGRAFAVYWPVNDIGILN